MNKTWTRIVIVVIAAAAVAFWVFFDRQRAPERQMDNALNAMPAWQVIKEQEPALHQRILDQMAALQKAGHGHLVGCVEDAAGSAPGMQAFPRQPKGRKPRFIRMLECQPA